MAGISGMVRLLGGERDLRPVHGNPARARQIADGREKLATRGDLFFHGPLQNLAEKPPIQAPQMSAREYGKLRIASALPSPADRRLQRLISSASKFRSRTVPLGSAGVYGRQVPVLSFPRRCMRVMPVSGWPTVTARSRR